MANCINCQYAVHEQFKGYKGRWICFHPYRRELDNAGRFTYPPIDNTKVVICETPVFPAPWDALRQADTPIWCYYEACKRVKKEEPSFDPDRQRQTLYSK